MIAARNLQHPHSKESTEAVYSTMSGGVVSPGAPACWSGRSFIYGLSSSARANTRSNGVHHASRRGEPFFFALRNGAGVKNDALL